MAVLLNPSIINNGQPSPYGKGSATVIEGTYPAGASSVEQVYGVGNLNIADLVDVVQLQAGTSAIGLIYLRAGSTMSAAGQGVVSIGPPDGVTVPQTDTKVQIRIFRNT